MSQQVSAQTTRWAQWRGDRLNSISTDPNAPADVDAKTAIKWRTELPGPAGASPIVWDDRVFLTSVDGDQAGDKLLLLCLGTDGKLIWKQELAGQNQNFRDSANSASPSPSTDGKHVWVMMSDGIVHCFTIGGELVWKRELQTDYGQFEIQFGMSSTPILDRGRLYITLIHGDMRDGTKTSEGHILALDAATGKEIWHHRRLTDATSENLHSYTSPTIYRDDQRAFLISHGADYVTGHSLEDGSEIWRCGGINIKGTNYNPYLRFVASPSCAPDLIVVPSAKRGPVIGLRPDLSGDVTGKPESRKWKMDVGTPDVASPLIYEGLVYLAEESGTLRCLDARDGKVVYQKRLLAGNHRSTPVAAAGRVYLTGRDGELVVVKAGREFEVVSKVDFNEETTASVAIANGVVYVRTFNALYAIGN